MTEHEGPIIVVSDGRPITVTNVSHAEMKHKIRQWAHEGGITAHAQQNDLRAMADAAITLLEVDEATGISLEAFGHVGTMVSRVVAYAFGHDPRYTTVHWTVS